MPVTAAYAPDPRFIALGDEFSDPVAAADFPQTVLRYRNERAAAAVGLARQGLEPAKGGDPFGVA
ncbi:MAG: selenoprotein O, partial [Brevundimonas sp.]